MFDWKPMFGLVAAIAIGPAASADVVNGEFEAGGTGWTVSVPGGWESEFAVSGGNPEGYFYVRSRFFDSAGSACIGQQFACGVDGSGECEVGVDYFSRSVDSSPLSGHVRIEIDGVVVFAQPDSDLIDWTTLEFTVPCGPHEIDLCLDVVDGNNAWEAGFDNVTARCDNALPTDEHSWSKLKLTFQ